jgi:pyruvate ferredoxin oxidoreductase beta subunit/2-oxoisovalerate ferredoxin oxidoreductase beta subunit
MLDSGHLACAGCGETLALRYVLKVLGKNAMMVIPACCATVVDGVWPHSAVNIPLLHTAFETAAAAAAGIRHALNRQGKQDTKVLAWAGDGGTFDIGIQAISSAAERNEDILYVCYDNEAYMNTGIQRSSATPWGSWTTTTPVDRPKDEPKKNMIEILAAHRIPYCATACVAYPEDLTEKVKKAISIRGFKFIHLISPCPPGWKMPPEMSIEMVRRAVRSKVFPLYEVENGDTYRITIMPEEFIPVREYLQPQGRFRHLSGAEINGIQERVDREWEKLMRKIEFSNGDDQAERSKRKAAPKRSSGKSKTAKR